MKTFISLCFALISGLIAFTQNVDKAMEYYNNEKYDSAAMEFEAALPLLEQKYGATDTTYYAKQLFHTAQSFEKNNQNEKAEQYYKKVKSIYETIQATLGDTIYAMTLNNLGVLYYDMGNYEAALPLYKQALHIYSEVLRDKHSDYANSLNNLAALYYSMGVYEAALSLYKEALKIYKEVLGDSNTDYANSLNNLAALYYSMGVYEAALPLYKEALKIYKEALGDNNTDYANSLYNLATLYISMGIYEAALPLYKEALKIYKEVFGEKNIDYAKVLYSLGILYFDMVIMSPHYVCTIRL